MKKNMYWFVMVAAIVMSAMTFVSCEDPFEEVLPEVIESEVLDEGVEDEIIETPSTDPEGTNTGTELSYKSWIMVKGQTRAAFEERVEVTLTNVFNNTDTTVVVDNFELGEYTTSLSHKVRKTREDGFVDIVDSVLVYTVSFENFSFDYELDYEVATYDDGYTKQVMPYHQIGAIKDKGYKLEDLDFVIDEVGEMKEKRVYLRKLLTHEISVDFQSKTYDLTAKVEIRKYVGIHPCIVKSELNSSAVYNEGADIISKLFVSRTYSDGTVDTEASVCRLGAYISFDELGYIDIRGFNNDLSIVSSELKSGGHDDFGSNADFVTCVRYKDIWTITYNYFSIDMNVVYDRAWYDDGLLKCEFPSLAITDISNATPELVFENSGENTTGKYSVYWLHQTVTAKAGEQVLEAMGTKQIVAYE